MKNKQFLAASIMMLSLQTIHAQGYIKRAFNVLTTSDPAKVESTHKLNKDPETGQKVGQLDVYEFTIPASHHDMIEDIEQAFDKDKEKAYSLSSGSNANKKTYNYITLAVGGDEFGYPLGDIKDSRYIYALFLDPADKNKTHRYAYAMEWHEGSKEIVGKLIVTYATTQQYRKSRKQPRIITLSKQSGSGISINDNHFFDDSMGYFFSSHGSDSIFTNRSISSESWLSQFSTFRNLFMNNPDGAAANYYASFIYKLCKQADTLDEVERQIVIKELEKVRKVTKDEFIQQMFDTSIERLRK